LTFCLTQIFKANKTKEAREPPWITASSNGASGKKVAKTTGAVVLGGTAFALGNKDVRSNRFDYLIIDEAAQFSLVDAMARTSAFEATWGTCVSVSKPLLGMLVFLQSSGLREMTPGHSV
jgi:hypothetical protein